MNATDCATLYMKLLLCTILLTETMTCTKGCKEVT